MGKGLGWLAIGFFVFMLFTFPAETAPLVRGFFSVIGTGLEQFMVFLDGAVPDATTTTTVPGSAADPGTTATTVDGTVADATTTTGDAFNQNASGG